MEWYTLDDSFKRSQVIEGFDSFIWTERYNRWGDFQIDITSNAITRALLKPDTWIGMAQSFRVMKIETVTDALDANGVKKLTVVGRSMESLLDERVAMPGLASLTATPNWTLSGTPGAIARTLFSTICVTGAISANDTIPGYTAGTFLPAGTIPEPAGVVTITFDPTSLYSDLTQICDIWSLGFRLVKNGDTGQIYFDVYTGKDRTSDQTSNSPVIFSIDMESIDKTSVISSTANIKTVAYVLAQNGALIVYADGFDSTVSADDRRVLLVDANDLDLAAGPLLNAAMLQRGQDELAKYRKVYSFDGEITQNQPYVYGVDYNLGDLVEERDPDGFINHMLVTEQIFVSDTNGERSYPTLALNFIIEPGSWISVPAGEHWTDVDPLITWNAF